MSVIEVFGMNEDVTKKFISFYAEEMEIKLPDMAVIVDDTLPDNCNGQCHEGHDNFFMILIRPRDFSQMLVTLAHEMVHVKQYIYDNLSEYLEPHIPYESRWYEMEAFEMEEELVIRAVKAIKRGDLNVQYSDIIK